MSTRPILLSGTVHGDSLTHTLQLLHAEGRTGHLHVHTPTGPGTLHLHAGRLTHAAYAGQVGEAALPVLFQLPPGTFEVFADPPTLPVTITRPLTQVLLTAAVALDHLAAGDAPHVPLPVARVSDAELEADLLGRDSPLRPTTEWVPALIADLQDLTLGADAWRVLTAVDGQREITVIAAHVALPLEQVRNVLAEHAARGHLTYLPPPLPRPAAPEYGSLTGYLRGTPEARQAIRTALTRQAHPAPAPMLASPLGANPGLVGTAFDYAFRFRLEGLNPGLVAVRGAVIARRAALDLEHDRTLAAVQAAEETLQEVALGQPFEVRHAHAAVLLASYEVVVRTGRFADLAGVVPREAAQDVLALIHAVPQGVFQAHSQLVLNPHFAAAGRFGGADADVLLDDLLIEVKATRHLQLEGAYLQQLTGYLILDRLGGTVGSALPIRRLGVYYARHGVLQVLPVKDLYRPGLLPQLVSWFDDSLPTT